MQPICAAGTQVTSASSRDAAADALPLLVVAHEDHRSFRLRYAAFALEADGECFRGRDAQLWAEGELSRAIFIDGEDPGIDRLLVLRIDEPKLVVLLGADDRNVRRFEDALLFLWIPDDRARRTFGVWLL